MKTIKLLIILNIKCKAQSPIISTVDWTNDDNGDIDLVDSCYLKDVEDKFTPFIGNGKMEILY